MRNGFARFLRVFIVSGMLGATAVCPCCGKPACPAGASIAASLTILLIPLKVVWAVIGNYFKRRWYVGNKT